MNIRNIGWFLVSMVICLFTMTEIKILPPTGISFACYELRQSQFLHIEKGTSDFTVCLAFQKVFGKVYHNTPKEIMLENLLDKIQKNQLK